MKIKSFDGDKNEVIKRDVNQNNLYNVFEKNMALVNGLIYIPYVVPREFEMRLDRISNHVYGSPNYVEELMIINDLISPYSIKEGQTIYICPLDQLGYIKTNDKLVNYNKTQKDNLIKSSQTNSKNENKAVPVNIMPDNLRQININKDFKIQIINSFE